MHRKKIALFSDGKNLSSKKKVNEFLDKVVDEIDDVSGEAIISMKEIMKQTKEYPVSIILDNKERGQFGLIANLPVLIHKHDNGRKDMVDIVVSVDGEGSIRYDMSIINHCKDAAEAAKKVKTYIKQFNKKYG